MSIPTPAEQAWADQSDGRLTEQIVIQESVLGRAELTALRQKYAQRGIKLSEAAAARMCFRYALPRLLAED